MKTILAISLLIGVSSAQAGWLSNLFKGKRPDMPTRVASATAEAMTLFESEEENPKGVFRGIKVWPSDGMYMVKIYKAGKDTDEKTYLIYECALIKKRRADMSCKKLDPQ